MNSKYILRWLAGGLLVSGLSACSTIKSLFPDKERDYQFTSEVPELIVPDDLQSKSLDALSRPAVAVVDTDTSAEPVSPNQAETIQSGTLTSEPDASEAEHKAEPDTSEPASASQENAVGNVSVLQIDQGKVQATRLVGKALTRKQVEIVERNIDRGYYYVKFDPYAVEAKDESIWDELNFLFGDDPSQEQEYRITVKQTAEQMSEVTVQDSSGKNLSNPVANALLKLITDGINEDLNPNAAQDPSKTNAEPNTPKSPDSQE